MIALVWVYAIYKSLNFFEILGFWQDWVGSAIDRKRTLGCCFSMGLGVISWFSRKQSRVALSAAEAEYGGIFFN